MNDRKRQPNDIDQYIGMPPVPPPSVSGNPFPMGGLGSEDIVPF